MREQRLDAARVMGCRLGGPRVVDSLAPWTRQCPIPLHTYFVSQKAVDRPSTCGIPLLTSSFDIRAGDIEAL
jgi:hypothetical protein